MRILKGVVKNVFTVVIFVFLIAILGTIAINDNLAHKIDHLLKMADNEVVLASCAKEARGDIELENKCIFEFQMRGWEIRQKNLGLVGNRPIQIVFEIFAMLVFVRFVWWIRRISKKR